MVVVAVHGQSVGSELSGFESFNCYCMLTKGFGFWVVKVYSLKFRV